MSGLKVLVSPGSFGKINNHALDTLKRNGCEVVLNSFGRTLTVDESKELMKDVDALIAGTEILDRSVLSEAKKLKYVCRLGIGMDNVDIVAAKELGIKVENTPNAHVTAVAELTLAGIMSLGRNIHSTHSNLKMGTWKKPMGFLIQKKTVGLIGLGRVAKHLVKLLQPFGVKFMAYDVQADAGFASSHEVSLVSLEEMYSNADIISLHIPYSSQSHHLINDQAMRLMKDSVMLVNTARGGLIDEQALQAFLLNNPSASAYLDTFEKEPYDGTLLSLDNILVTPHIGSYAKETRLEMELATVDNLLKFYNNG